MTFAGGTEGACGKADRDGGSKRRALSVIRLCAPIMWLLYCEKRRDKNHEGDLGVEPCSKGPSPVGRRGDGGAFRDSLRSW